MTSVHPFISNNLSIDSSESLTFPFLDYGFLYGYGLFESIRVYKKKPLLIRDHFTRLRRGSIILDIPFEYEQSVLIDHVNELIEKNDVEDAILNIYLTPGNRPNDPSQRRAANQCFMLMVMRPWPDYTDQCSISLEVRQESFQRTPLDRFKTLSWMKNVLEKRLSTEADDVILYNQAGHVLETSSSNLFFVKNNTIYTPKSNMILSGITRQFLMNHQNELGIEVIMRPIELEELFTFDEVFVTNSLRGIFMVESVVGYDHLKSGDKAQLLQQNYRQLLLQSSTVSQAG